VPHPTDQHVGAEIARRRLLQGANQSELGRALGVTFQQIQKYEKGGNRVSASKLLQAAEFLGCEVGDFFPPKGSSPGESAARSDFFGLRGAAGLAKAYEALDPAKRKLLVNLAAELLPPVEGEAADPELTRERYGDEEQLRAG
jgi:transcriptional regulator with XRE-family HTH domain